MELYEYSRLNNRILIVERRKSNFSFEILILQMDIYIYIYIYIYIEIEGVFGTWSDI